MTMRKALFGKPYAVNPHVGLDKRKVGCIVAGVAIVCLLRARADVIYTVPPDDVSAIVVSNTTTKVGLEGHLKQHWTFDDANNLFVNSAGTVSLSARSGSVAESRTSDDAKVGGGALYTDNGLQASENVIDGKHAFTIMFWINKSTWTNSQHTLIYIGEKPKSGGEQIQDKHFFRLSYGNLPSGESSSDQLFLWENQTGLVQGSHNTAIGTAGAWNHIALVCTVVERAGCVTTNKYTAYLNGAWYKTLSAPQNDFKSTDYLFFGFGWNYSRKERSLSGGVLDEIMIFDTPLTEDEIAAICVHSLPREFSANWLLPIQAGVLDLAGTHPQSVSGYGGTVSTEAGLTLQPTRSTIYAGVIASASLTLDAASSAVTQTLAGANAYTGTTHVKAGTLVIDPQAAFPTLESELVAYWPCDTLSSSSRMLADMSGNGNHLYPYGADGDATIDAESFVVDGAIRFPKTEAAGKGYARNVSGGLLRGFADEDNSFTVAFWMRIDSADGTGGTYKGGPFSFGGRTGVRLNVSSPNTSGSTLCFGDRSCLASTSKATADGHFGGSDKTWRHFALTFDAKKANGTADCFSLYTNGALCAATSEYNTNYVNHAYASFYLGWCGLEDDGIDGALDDVVVLNGASAADVAALYSWRRAAHEAADATHVLPDTTQITVDADATLCITNANERAKSLAGAGTLHIAVGSTLWVNSRKDFTGIVTGGGKLIYPGFTLVVR